MNRRYGIWINIYRSLGTTTKDVAFSVYMSMSSSVRLSVVCRLSVSFVRPTQATEIFDNVSAPVLSKVLESVLYVHLQTDSEVDLYVYKLVEWPGLNPNW